MNKFLVTYGLMSKCIESCDIIEQLEVMVDWIEYAMKKELYPNEDVTAARSLLFKAIIKQKEKIQDIQSEEEIDHLTATSIHPQ